MPHFKFEFFIFFLTFRKYLIELFNFIVHHLNYNENIQPNLLLYTLNV